MARFKSHLQDLDNDKTMVFTFGRFAPPHKGHYMLWESVAKEAKRRRGDAIVYTSWSFNTKKNPLTPSDKSYFIKKMMPKGISFSEDQSLKNTQQIAKDLIAKGYTRIVLMVGADRLKDFESMKKQVQDFSDGACVLEVVSFSGKSRIGNYSGTRMRNLAKENNFEEFYADLPKAINKKEAQDLFEKVRIGLGVK